MASLVALLWTVIGGIVIGVLLAKLTKRGEAGTSQERARRDRECTGTERGGNHGEQGPLVETQAQAEAQAQATPSSAYASASSSCSSGSPVMQENASQADGAHGASLVGVTSAGVEPPGSHTLTNKNSNSSALQSDFPKDTSAEERLFVGTRDAVKCYQLGPDTDFTNLVEIWSSAVTRKGPLTLLCDPPSLYIFSRGTISCLAHTTGQELWTSVFEELQGNNGASLVIFENMLVVGANYSLYFIDKSNGTKLWEMLIGKSKSKFSNAVVTLVENGVLYAGSSGHVSAICHQGDKMLMSSLPVPTVNMVHRGVTLSHCDTPDVHVVQVVTPGALISVDSRSNILGSSIPIDTLSPVTQISFKNGVFLSWLTLSCCNVKAYTRSHDLVWSSQIKASGVCLGPSSQVSSLVVIPSRGLFVASCGYVFQLLLKTGKIISKISLPGCGYPNTFLFYIKSHDKLLAFTKSYTYLIEGETPIPLKYKWDDKSFATDTDTLDFSASGFLHTGVFQ